MNSTKSEASSGSKHSGTKLNSYLYQRESQLTKKFSEERNGSRGDQSHNVVLNEGRGHILSKNKNKNRSVLPFHILSFLLHIRIRKKNIEYLGDTWAPELKKEKPARIKQAVTPNKYNTTSKLKRFNAVETISFGFKPRKESDDNTRLFKLDEFALNMGKLNKSSSKGVLYSFRNNGMCEYGPKDESTARSTWADVSTHCTSVAKHKSGFSRLEVQDCYQSLIISNKRAISKDDISKMKEKRDQNVKKYYLNKKCKAVKVNFLQKIVLKLL